MAIKLITRKQWDARDSRGASTLASTRGVKIHYTGSAESPAMATDHQRCYARVRSIQNGHMDDRKWNDIAYSYVACEHGYVFEGRGCHILPAANGAGLNSGHYAILGMVGNAGLVEPSPDMYGAICDAIAYVRLHGDAGRQIRGHRDGYSTDCPGTILYRWVTDGASCLGQTNDHDDDQGDDMPSHVKVALGKAMALPADQWTTLTWTTESNDPKHQHADEGGPSVLNGPATYDLTASITLTGMPIGTEYQVRAIEIDADGKGADTLGPIGEGLASSGNTYALYTPTGEVAEGRRVRVQVKPIGHAATAAAGSCELNYWR